MAISEETAALIAAQLTVAWATRAGVRPAHTAQPFEAEVAAVYLRYRDAIREEDITPNSFGDL